VNPGTVPLSVSSEEVRHQGVAAVRLALNSCNPSTLAALRKAAANTPPAAFHLLAARALDSQLPDGPWIATLRQRWAVVVSAMASAEELLASTPLGEALFRAEVPELRVGRLLESHDAQLAEQVRHVVQQLVQRGQPFDPNDLADLVLTDGTPYAPQPRSRIARDYLSDVND
jgi:hypothetical protein